MGVYTMNGAAPAAMVFTPNQQYDLYTFEGCGFGASPGQLTLIGHFKTFKLALIVVDWTDTSIIAALDTSVAGEPDENGNVSLILSRADGQRLQFNGNSFYAARASVTLQSIPQTWATLGPVRDAGNLPVTPGYLQGPDYASVTVIRSSVNRFSGGQDYYDLSHLNPQFSADSFLLYALPAGCTTYGNVTQYIDGYTTGQWDSQGNILIKLGGTTCHTAGNSNDDAEENYNFALTVTGPRDVDPLQTM